MSNQIENIEETERQFTEIASGLAEVLKRDIGKEVIHKRVPFRRNDDRNVVHPYWAFWYHAGDETMIESGAKIGGQIDPRVTLCAMHEHIFDGNRLSVGLYHIGTSETILKYLRNYSKERGYGELIVQEVFPKPI